jgi:hypothetical protein
MMDSAIIMPRDHAQAYALAFPGAYGERPELAEHTAQFYAAIPKVAAVLLAGSVACGSLGAGVLCPLVLSIVVIAAAAESARSDLQPVWFLV